MDVENLPSSCSAAVTGRVNTTETSKIKDKVNNYNTDPLMLPRIFYRIPDA